MSYWICESFANNCPERCDFDGFHKDCISLYPDGSQGLVQCWVAAEYHCYCTRVGVAHGADDSEAITRVRHVQVGEQQVKALCSDAIERLTHGRYGDDFKAVAFQRFPQHIANRVVVLGQQYSRHT